MASQDLVFDLKMNISRSDLWNFWTDPEQVERWLTVKARIATHLGGAYELFWEPATPAWNSTLGCRIIGYTPTKLLAFQWRGPLAHAAVMNTDPAPTWVTVTFEELADDQCLMHFRHSGWGEGARWEAARTWQKNAWCAAFRELQALTETEAAATAECC